MAWTGLSLVKEGRRTFLSAVKDALPPPENLRRVDAREPWRGAARQTVDRVVQWMYDTEKAILIYDFAGDCQFWLPRWLWPRGAVVEMAGEAGPIALPSYIVSRLRLS